MAMTCPRDGSILVRKNNSGIEIDTCPSCRGVWLDRGELERLVSQERDYRYDDDDDNYRPTSDYRGSDPYKRKKKKGFLGDMFDIFD